MYELYEELDNGSKEVTERSGAEGMKDMLMQRAAQLWRGQPWGRAAQEERGSAGDQRALWGEQEMVSK